MIEVVIVHHTPDHSNFDHFHHFPAKAGRFRRLDLILRPSSDRSTGSKKAVSTTLLANFVANISFFTPVPMSWRQVIDFYNGKVNVFNFVFSCETENIDSVTVIYRTVVCTKNFLKIDSSLQQCC
jgi:hypothetical protein